MRQYDIRCRLLAPKTYQFICRCVLVLISAFCYIDSLGQNAFMGLAESYASETKYEEELNYAIKALENDKQFGNEFTWIYDMARIVEYSSHILNKPLCREHVTK